MKNFRLISNASLISIFIITCTLFTSGCDDDTIDNITTDNTDTIETPIDTTIASNPINYSFTEIYEDSSFIASELSVEAQNRNYLLEEFTGVRCPNCPAAHAIVADILNNNPSNVFAIAAHAGFLTAPHTGSSQDFRTDAGTEVYNYFQASGQPVLMINRHTFTEENSVLLNNRNIWENRFNTYATSNGGESDLNLYIYHTFNQASGLLHSYVQLVYPSAMEASTQHYSVAIIENNISAPQATSSGLNNNYVHQHVLRDYISNAIGNTITNGGSVAPNTVITKALPTYNIPSNWNINELYIVAFVHTNGSNGNSEILQVAQTPLVP